MLRDPSPLLPRERLFLLKKCFVGFEPTPFTLLALYKSCPVCLALVRHICHIVIDIIMGWSLIQGIVCHISWGTVTPAGWDRCG